MLKVILKDTVAGLGKAGDVKQVKVPGTDKTLPYDSLKRLGIGHAVLDTSQAVAIGAYVFALGQLDA